jgi:hypothetical protein
MFSAQRRQTPNRQKGDAMKSKRFRYIAAATAFLMLCGGSAGAQVNIENMRGGSGDEGFSTGVHFLFSTRSGNVDITQLGLNIRTDIVTEKTTSFAVLRGLYGWQSGTPFSNEGLLHLRHVFQGRVWIQPEVYVQFDYDKARRLTYRSVGGGGLRFNVFNGEIVEFSIGTSYMVEHERFDLPPDALHSQKTTDHRWSNYLSLRAKFNDDASLVWTSYVQPRFDAFDDLKTIGEGGLEFEVTDLLALTLTMRLRYDSAPPDGVEKRDTLFMTGLRMDF